MEINVNRLVADIDPFELSASMAERGQNAGKETWNNAKEEAKRKRVLKPAQRAAARAHFAEYGAWPREEIARWSASELDALVLQEAAGDLRELQSLCPGEGLADIDWEEAERLAEVGTVPGSLFVHEGELWVSLGS